MARHQLHHKGHDAAAGTITRTRTRYLVSFTHAYAINLILIPFMPSNTHLDLVSCWPKGIRQLHVAGEKGNIPQVRQCAGCTTPESDANTSSDRVIRKQLRHKQSHIFFPPAPQEGMRPSPSNSIPQDTGRRTWRGVPAATWPLAMPLSALLSTGAVVGSSTPASNL